MTAEPLAVNVCQGIYIVYGKYQILVCIHSSRTILQVSNFFLTHLYKILSLTFDLCHKLTWPIQI